MMNNYINLYLVLLPARVILVQNEGQNVTDTNPCTDVMYNCTICLPVIDMEQSGTIF